jgi:hypothetical protein
MRRLVCDRCHGVIGVYEPLVTIVDGEPCRTSLAADPDLTRNDGPSYHLKCFAELSDRED